MERAKRLERDGVFTQPTAAPDTCESVQAPGALGDAHEEKCPETIAPESAPARLVETNDDADLREVIAAWSELNPKLKVAILAIVRAS